jgi:hypothetical protein
MTTDTDGEAARNQHTASCWRFNPSGEEQCAASTVLDLLGDSAEKGRLGFFFGAGASRGYPACLPVSARLTRGLRDLLGCDLSMLSEDQKRRLNDKLGTLGLESLLNAYVDVFSEEVLSFYDIFRSVTRNPGPPTPTAILAPAPMPSHVHSILAGFGAAGMCRLFITLNFDVLFETAFEALNPQSPLIVPESLSPRGEVKAYREFVARRKDSCCHLFKLHGSLRGDDPSNTRLLTTVERVAISLPRHKLALLRHAASNYDMCYLGYSDNDFDTFPVILSATQGRQVVWFLHKNTLAEFWNPARPEDSPTPRLVRWWRDTGAYVVVSKEPSAFLGPLGERLGVPAFRYYTAMLSPAQLEDKRETDVSAYFRDYRRRFFKDDSAALLMLGMIATTERTYDVASALLRRVRAMAKASGVAGGFVEFHYNRHMAEVYRSEGLLSRAIVSWRAALNLLTEGETDPRRRERRRLTALVRMGSEYMGKAKRQAAAMAKGSKAKALYRALQCSIKAGCLFARVHIGLLVDRPSLRGFDASVVRSYLIFEAADFFQAITEGVLYFWAKASESRLRRVEMLAARICARIAAGLYGRTLRIQTQDPGMYFFQMYRRAEMLAVASAGRAPESLRLVTEAASRLGKMKNQWVNACIDTEDEVEQALSDNTAASAGVVLLFGGNLERAARLLRLAYRDFVREGHKSGKVKCRTYYAVLKRQQGNVDAARRLLSGFDRVVSQYH